MNNWVVRVGVIAGVAGFILLGTHDHWRAFFTDAPPTVEHMKPETVSGKQVGAPVIVATVGELPDTVILKAIGTARAFRSVMLYPEAAGEIIDFPVQPESRVKKDAVILRIDSRNTRLAVQVAETRVREAENELFRARKLEEQNVRSAANVEDAALILERAKLEVSLAREALADRTLRAPFDGIVGIPKVEIGDRVTREMPIVSLDDRTTLLVEFEVAERFFTRLATEMPVYADTPAFGEQKIEGIIDKIDSRIDPVARTALLRASFPNAEDRLRPGMSFAITLELPGPVLPTVPELSLQWGDGRSYVWRVVDGVAERVDVLVRRRLNDTVLLEGDLKPGDTVVVEGVQRLHPGARVYTPEDLAG